MRSVPIIQDWIDHGWQEGRQEGYTQACREGIVSILEKRFGIVKPSLLDELEKVQRVENLKMLLNKTIEVQTQEELLSLIKLAAGE